MQRPIDPMAALSYGTAALILTAVFLGTGPIDDGAVGLLDVAVAGVPFAVFVTWLVVASRERSRRHDELEHKAVEVLTAQAIDPTISGADPVSRAAAALMMALDDAERAEARATLARLLER